MARAELAIVFDPDTGGGAYDLVHVKGDDLLFEAARRAITAQARWAEKIGRRDSMLGMLEAAETDRLRSVLGALIPDLPSTQ